MFAAMSEAHRRKKQPELLQEQLLTATAHLLAERGIEAVTLNAVAATAGVSKGGLQHHFSSKQELLDALASRLYQQFVDEIALCQEGDPEPRGRDARAYVRACASGLSGGEERELWKAATVLMMTQSAFRARWQAWEAQAARADREHPQDANRLLMCRLAADGLWLADLLGHRTIDAAQREALLRELESATYGND